MKATKNKKQVRDPNVPVLSFTIGDTTHEILVAGPNDRVKMESNPQYRFTPNSLIVRRRSSNGGVDECEHDLYDPGTWGWIGRLIAGGGGDWLKLNTPTDRELLGM